MHLNGVSAPPLKSLLLQTPVDLMRTTHIAMTPTRTLLTCSHLQSSISEFICGLR